MPRPLIDHRRLAASMVSRMLWKRRGVFWAGALAVGVVSVAFAAAADLAQHLFGTMRAAAWWLPLILTPAGFVACAHLARSLIPAAQGSGIPQAIAAREMRGAADRSWLLAPKVVFGKILLTVAGLLVGASVGREGPTVQVGAGLMLWVARQGHLQRERGLILAGSAAGIAAAFNTPLAGIVFAIEEMSHAYEQRTHGLVLHTVIIAGLASLALLGNYTYFGSSPTTATTVADWALTGLCGVVGGAAGGLFTRGMLSGARRSARWIVGGPKWRGLAFALGCGVVVAVVGVATDGATFGTGYSTARAAVEGGDVGPVFWIAKLIATLATAISGIPGGIFAPSLSVGAGLGGYLGEIVGHPGGLAAVLGMAGYFAGVVQSPMTAFVIIMEMTDGHANMIPLMLTVMIGYAVSRLVAPEPLYQTLARGFVRRPDDGRTAAKPQPAE
jgi:H+/Cl- antiporter ClcA